MVVGDAAMAAVMTTAHDGSLCALKAHVLATSTRSLGSPCHLIAMDAQPDPLHRQDGAVRRFALRPLAIPGFLTNSGTTRPPPTTVVPELPEVAHPNQQDGPGPPGVSIANASSRRSAVATTSEKADGAAAGEGDAALTVRQATGAEGLDQNVAPPHDLSRAATTATELDSEAPAVSSRVTQQRRTRPHVRAHQTLRPVAAVVGGGVDSSAGAGDGCPLSDHRGSETSAKRHVSRVVVVDSESDTLVSRDSDTCTVTSPIAMTGAGTDCVVATSPGMGGSPLAHAGKVDDDGGACDSDSDGAGDADQCCSDERVSTFAADQAGDSVPPRACGYASESDNPDTHGSDVAVVPAADVPVRAAALSKGPAENVRHGAFAAPLTALLPMADEALLTETPSDGPEDDDAAAPQCSAPVPLGMSPTSDCRGGGAAHSHAASDWAAKAAGVAAGSGLALEPPVTRARRTEAVSRCDTGSYTGSAAVASSSLLPSDGAAKAAGAAPVLEAPVPRPVWVPVAHAHQSSIKAPTLGRGAGAGSLAAKADGDSRRRALDSTRVSDSCDMESLSADSCDDSGVDSDSQSAAHGSVLHADHDDAATRARAKARRAARQVREFGQEFFRMVLQTCKFPSRYNKVWRAWRHFSPAHQIRELFRHYTKRSFLRWRHFVPQARGVINRMDGIIASSTSGGAEARPLAHYLSALAEIRAHLSTVDNPEKYGRRFIRRGFTSRVQAAFGFGISRIKTDKHCVGLPPKKMGAFYARGRFVALQLVKYLNEHDERVTLQELDEIHAHYLYFLDTSAGIVREANNGMRLVLRIVTPVGATIAAAVGGPPLAAVVGAAGAAVGVAVEGTLETVCEMAGHMAVHVGVELVAHQVEQHL